MTRPAAPQDEAVSPVVAVVLLLGMGVVFSSLAFVLYSSLGSSAEAERVVSGAHANFRGGDYNVFLAGPDDVPLEGSQLRATIDGVDYTFPLTDLAGQVEDGKHWQVGEQVCILGPPPCLVQPVGDVPAGGREVAIEIVAPENVVFQLPPLKWLPSFLIDDDGGIRIQCSVPAVMEVLGAEITYGAGGPDIPVTVGLSMDGDPPFEPLFGGAAVNGGGQVHDLHLVPAGSVLGVQGRAHYQSFDETRVSFDDDPHVYVLRDGDEAPDFAPFAGQAPLEGFLAPYVDVQTGTMVLEADEAIVLFEFVDNLQSSAADFQDLVVLFNFEMADCPA